MRYIIGARKNARRSWKTGGRLGSYCAVAGSLPRTPRPGKVSGHVAQLLTTESSVILPLFTVRTVIAILSLRSGTPYHDHASVALFSFVKEISTRDAIAAQVVRPRIVNFGPRRTRFRSTAIAPHLFTKTSHRLNTPLGRCRLDCPHTRSAARRPDWLRSNADNPPRRRPANRGTSPACPGLAASY